MLASYDIGGKVLDYDFQTLDDGRIIVLSVLEPKSDGLPYTCQIYEVSFREPEIRELYNGDLVTETWKVSTSLRDPVAVVLFECDTLVRLVIIDYRQGTKRLLRTSVAHEPRPEVFQSKEGAIVLIASLAKTMDISVFLGPFDNVSETATIRPDHSLTVEYDPGSVYTDNVRWSTYHKGNPYSRPLLGVFTTSRWSLPGSTQSSDMYSVEWLNLDGLVQDLQTTGSQTRLPPRRRNVQRLKTKPLMSWDDEPLWRIGSLGIFACWLEENADEAGYRWQLLPLLDPALEPELGWDRSDCLHTLKVPIDMGSVLRLLAISEEAPTLFILTAPCTEGCCPRSIRMFEY